MAADEPASTTNIFAVPGITSDKTMAETFEDNLDTLVAGQRQVEKQRTASKAKKAAVVAGVKVPAAAVETPKAAPADEADEDDDIPEAEAAATKDYLDRYLAPVAAAAPGMDDAWVAQNKRDLPAPIVNLTPEQIQAERTSAETAFDFYRKVYDDNDGDTEKTRAQILSKGVPGIEDIARDSKAFEALVDLADKETKPYSWFTRAYGAVGDADYDTSAAQTKEEFVAGRAARAVTMGPNSRRFVELTTVFTPGALPEIDIADTQAALIEDYRLKYATDAQVEGRTLAAEDWQEIEGRAINAATQDIRHAMSSVGRPIIYSLGADKTPLEMALENDRATGLVDRTLDSAGGSILEAKFRWKTAELPTEAGAMDTALVKGGNALGLLGQVLMAIDPTEIVGTSLDVAAKEYRRSLAAAEQDGDVADSGEVLLSAAKGVLAGGYANSLQMFPLMPYDEILSAAGAVGVVPEEANAWRERVVRDTIISSGDNEDYFDTVTDALPTFTAAGWRAATGEENTVEMKKWFLENQLAAKSALMLVAIKTPMLPVTSVLGPVGDVVSGASRARRVPTEIAKTIENGISNGAEVGRIVQDVDNAFGVGVGGAAKAVALSAAANAAERDVDLLTREVGDIVSAVRGGVSPARIAAAETAADTARVARDKAIGDILGTSKIDDATVAGIRADVDTEDLRRLIDPLADPTQPSKMSDAISDWASAISSVERSADDMLQTTDLMDKALEHTAKVRGAIDDVLLSARGQIEAAEGSIDAAAIATVKEVSNAQRVLKRQMDRLAELKKTVPGAGDIMDEVTNLARAKRNEGALRLQLKRLRESAGSPNEMRPRADVEAEIAALEQIQTKTRQDYAKLQHLKARLAGTPASSPDVRIFSADAQVVMGMIRNNRRHIERGQAALEALKVKSPKAYATAEGIIGDMQAAARVLSDTDKLQVAANTRLAQKQVEALVKQQKNLLGVIKKLDAVDAHIALKTKMKYPATIRPMKALKGSAVNEVALRRAAALRRANTIAKRRAAEAAGVSPEARRAAEIAWAKQNKEAVSPLSRAARAAAREAAALRLVAVQQQALADFAASLRRGAAEVSRRKISSKSLTYRTGLPEQDLRIIDQAKDELTRRLGADDVFGKSVGTQEQYVDHVVASVMRVADDIAKDMDPDDLRRVIDEAAPAATVDFATLGTKEGRHAALEAVTRALAETQYAGFRAVGDVKMEHLHQSVSEAMGVVLQTRRAERDVFAALAVQQAAWARQGFRYALYKLVTPRAGFIGEGSDQAWRVYQHADQVSAGLQAWLVVHSQKAIDDLMKSGGQYTRKELADRLLTTMSEAFGTVGGKARLGLPVDTLTPFEVAKRFLLERSPSAHSPTLTPAGAAVRDSTRVEELLTEMAKAQTARERAARTHHANQIVSDQRARDVRAVAETLARKEADLASRTAENVGNATQAAEAKVRKAELEAQRAAAEQNLSKIPQDIIDDAVKAEEEALGKLTAEYENLNKQRDEIDKRMDKEIRYGSKQSTAKEQAAAVAKVKEMEAQVTPERVAERRAKTQAAWEAEQAKGSGALFGRGKKTPVPVEVQSHVTRRLAEGARPEVVLLEAANLPGIRWAASGNIRRAFHPDRPLTTVGGLAGRWVAELKSALRNMESLAPTETWRPALQKRYVGFQRTLTFLDMLEPDMEKAAVAAARDIASELSAPKNVADARKAILNVIKKGETYNRTRAEAMNRLFAQITGEVDTGARVSPAFVDSDALKALETQIAKERADIADMRTKLNASSQSYSDRLKAIAKERDKVSIDRARVSKQIQAQAVKVKAAKEGRLKDGAAADYIKGVNDDIAIIDDELKSLRAQIGTYDRFSRVDLTSLEDEVKRLAETLAKKEKAAKIASDRAAGTKKALDEAVAAVKVVDDERLLIESRARGLSAADLKGAIDESALDEATMSLFDKIILNMGRSVFRGMEATALDEQSLNRILFGVAKQALDKSDDFKALHENIRKGIGARLGGGAQRILDDRAPRTATALSAALMQAVTAEYTTQYALREGLAIVQKTEAMAFNALLNQPISNSLRNPTTVIRDMYSTMEQVLRTGARLGRPNEGRSTLPIFDPRGTVSLKLTEAAKLKGFEGGVWVPENVLRTSLEDLEAYARQMDVLVATAPAEIGTWLADKAKNIFSIWRTSKLVGYGVNFGTYRMRAVTGDIASTYMVFGAAEATRVAAISAANVLPFVRVGAVKKAGALGELSNKAVASLAATTAAWRNATQPVKLLAPGTWQNLPRRIGAALLDVVAEVPRALAGITSPHVGRMLGGDLDDVLRIGDTEKTVRQWWEEARLEGVLDNNVEINLRTALRRSSEMWAEITSRRHSWAAVELEFWKQKKITPEITREAVRQSMEASESVKTATRTSRIKHALLRHQETLERTEAQVHVTTRITLYTSLRKQGLTAKEAGEGVKAAIYDWNYGANRAILNMTAFVPFGRFHVLRKQQGLDMLNMTSDTSPWRSMGGGSLAPIRRAALLERYMASSTQSEIPSEEELDIHLTDARAYGASMADEWGMTQQEAAVAAEQETLSFLISAWWARAHSPDYLSNRQYFYDMIPQEQQESFKKAYGATPSTTLAMTSRMPQMSVWDAFEVLNTGAALAEITFATLNGEDVVAQNAMSRLTKPWIDLLPDPVKALLAVFVGKAGAEMDAIEQGRHTPQMLASATPAEAALLDALGYSPVTLGISDSPIRSILTTTKEGDGRPRAAGMWSKSLLSAMRMDPVITPALTKTLNAAAYKNPRFGKDWDAARAAYTFSNLTGITSYGVTDPIREATFDVKDVKESLMRKQQTAAGAARQGARAIEGNKP